MGFDLLCIGVVFATMALWFSVLKRPLYEGMLVAFVILLTMTQKWGMAATYIYDAMISSSLYAIVVFLIAASVLGRTPVMNQCIEIILAAFGRIRGGAGYVAIIGSTFMGSLSGSGPGNVVATGTFTIPAMKRSGFPDYLAANVESQASTMGNMIPPAGMIVIAFNCLDALYPGKYSMSQYWMLLWGIALWFALQRIVTLYIMCRYYKVEPMQESDIPDLRRALKKGWKTLLLPVIVFLPFYLDSQFGELLELRLGAGAKLLSSNIILFIPALLAFFSLLLSGKNDRFTFSDIRNFIGETMERVIPTGALVMFAYFISNLLEDMNVGANFGELINSLNVSKYLMVFLLPAVTAVMGMVMPGSSQIRIFGTAIISVVAAAGGDPFLAAGMLPCICGAMHGVTPPYAIVMYTAMGIAGSGLKETTKNAVIWLVIHYLLSVVVMLGCLPVLGMV